MLICSDCGNEFEKPATHTETHSLDTPPFEERVCCPFCKSSNIREKNTTHCRCCGAKLREREEYCSEACRRKGEAMWHRERILHRLFLANPISRIVREAEQYNKAHGTSYSYGQYVAYVLPKRGKK